MQNQVHPLLANIENTNYYGSLLASVREENCLLVPGVSSLEHIKPEGTRAPSSLFFEMLDLVNQEEFAPEK